MDSITHSCLTFDTKRIKTCDLSSDFINELLAIFLDVNEANFKKENSPFLAFSGALKWLEDLFRDSVTKAEELVVIYYTVNIATTKENKPQIGAFCFVHPKGYPPPIEQLGSRVTRRIGCTTLRIPMLESHLLEHNYESYVKPDDGATLFGYVHSSQLLKKNLETISGDKSSKYPLKVIPEVPATVYEFPFVKSLPNDLQKGWVLCYSA